MRRPAGVIIAAILLGIVALFGILGEALALGVAIFSHSPVIPKIPGVRAMMISFTALELAFFVFCAWTVVGLFRMRPWSRVAAIVIAGVMTFFTACGGLGMFLARHYAAMLPPGPASANVDTAMVGMALFCFLFSLISIWWIVYFSLSSTRRAFAGAQAVGVGADGTTGIVRPASRTSGWRIVIIVWACLMLCSIFSLPWLLWTGMPMYLFGAMLSGSAGMVAVIVLWAVEVYLAVGLLRKWKAAWYLGLVFQVFVIANSATVMIPGARMRLLDAMQEIVVRSSGGLVTAEPFMNGTYLVFGFGSGVIMALVLVWALIARKDDYLHA